MNVEMFPSLAEACMNRGDRELAIESYRRSIELNLENRNGRDMLRQLSAALPIQDSSNIFAL